MGQKQKQPVLSWRDVFWGMSLARLFKEQPGVRGCGWFAKIPSATNRMHVLGNFTRTFIWCTCAPLLIGIHIIIPLLGPLLPFPPELTAKIGRSILHSLSRSGEEDNAMEGKLGPLPDVVLTDRVEIKGSALTLRKARYEVSTLHPRWVLRIVHPLSWENITNPRCCQQVSWSRDVSEKGYTALSYYINSAVALWKSAGYDPPSGRTTIPQRRCLALRYLLEYSRAYVAKYGDREKAQFVWIDELCISPLDISTLGPMHLRPMPPLWSHLQTDDMKHERNQELGRLTDIFRIARYVCVFCEDFGCDHTGVTCVWGQRVWTLAEIVHASTVLQMSAVRVNSSCWEWDLREIEGRLFKGSMKGHAEREQRWHLQAVMEHATNAGSTSWQKTIQALVIEVIHRSDTTGYGYKGRKTYTQLGRALNGLLPRRADPRCFSETNGWADLAMLLELNQGFYNTAALAAVCPVAHDTEDLHRWLAKPIAPKPGQERLEPLITAFPVTDPSSHTSLTPEQRKGIPLTMSSKTFENSGLNTALCLVNPSVIELAPSFVRNGSMIYSKEMKPVRLTAMGISILLAAVGGLLIYFGYSTGTSGSNGSSPPDNNESPNSSDDGSSTSDNDPSSTFGINGMFISGILLIWLGACAYALVRLVLGTMCVNMEGWVCWDEPDDVGDVDKIHFSRRRSQFRTWDADHNLAPEFPLPDNMPSRNIVIFDLKHRVRVSVQIPLAAKKPSYMIPIALHGSGITCMLIADQEEDSEEDDDDDVIEDYVWAKVGMIHLPTYILAEAKAVRTLLVGGRRPKPRVEWS